MMEETEYIRLLISYAEWLIIIILTNLSFSFFSKKYDSFIKLLPIVLIPIWIFIAFIKGMEYMYFDQSTVRLTKAFDLLLAETLPMIIIFGGITFGIKFKKFRKRKNSGE